MNDPFNQALQKIAALEQFVQDNRNNDDKEILGAINRIRDQVINLKDEIEDYLEVTPITGDIEKIEGE